MLPLDITKTSRNTVKRHSKWTFNPANTHGMYLLRMGGGFPTRTEKANEVARCLL